VKVLKIILGIAFYPYGAYLIWNYFKNKKQTSPKIKQQKAADEGVSTISFKTKEGKTKKEAQKKAADEGVNTTKLKAKEGKIKKETQHPTPPTNTEKQKKKTKKIQEQTIKKTDNKRKNTHELDIDLKTLEQELSRKIKEDARYSGGILKSQIRQVITTIKLNMIYLQTIRTISVINQKKPFKNEAVKELELNKSYSSFIDSQIEENQRFKGSLIDVHNEQLKLCLSAIKLNAILISHLSSKKNKTSGEQIKKEIKEAEILSAKYRPCLVKSNIELRLLILSISLNTINIFETHTLSENKIKTAISLDEQKIKSLSPNIYSILLSVRKKTYQILLAKLKPKQNKDIAKIKNSNDAEIKTTTAEIKKYGPSTFKYVLAIQKEYCQYLKNA